MKEQKFLAKLKIQKKLEPIESSEEMKDSYLEKSESNLDSAKILLENNKLEEPINMSYYSMYNSLLALLFKTGIKSENHSGSIILLKYLFNIDNSDIKKAKKERIDKQYYIDFNITNQEVKNAIVITEEFNSQILDFIEKLNQQSIEDYKKRFLEIK